MKKPIFLLTFLALSLLATSCFEASKNGRTSAPPPPTTPPKSPLLSSEQPKYLKGQWIRPRGGKLFSYQQAQGLVDTSEVNLVPDPKIIDIDMQTIKVLPNARDCGISFDKEKSIETRAQDCKSVNENNPNAVFWDGKENALVAEGDWRLVAKANGHAIWQDISTGLVWSDILDEVSFEQALNISGNFNQKSCHILNEDLLGFGADEIRWYLPGRHEYLLADLHGQRFVMTDQLSDQRKLWTSFYDSQTDQVLVIQANTSFMNYVNPADEYYFRCVGIVLK